MNASSFGKYFGITTFGESHGKVIGVVLDDVKPGVEFPYDDIKKALEKRRPGKGRFSSSRNEKDNFEVLSGVFNGKTTGMPICIIVYNKDYNSADYDNIKDIFRPSHADYTFYHKFKIYDYRGGGRASGRETVARVIAGEFANELLGDIKIYAYPIKIGEIAAKSVDLSFENELNWHDRQTYPKLQDYLKKIKDNKDSVGGMLEVTIKNMPIGIGDPVFEKLDANIAKAVLSIGAVKGIEFGKGFVLSSMLGSNANDQMNKNGFLSNNAGGILGGISTGEDIVFRVAVKPTSSIGIPQRTIDKKGEDKIIRIEGRHDTCIVFRIIPVAVAMIKLVLADAISYQKLLSGENRTLSDYREAFEKIDEDILLAIYRRMMLSKEIGKYKKNHNIPVEDKKREKSVIEVLKKKAIAWDLSSEIVEKIWKILFEESKKNQL